MPDYKYKGEVFSEEEIIEAAEKKGVSFEDYITEFDIIKIDDTVKPSTTVPGAGVEPAIAPTITEPPLENISLESLDADVKTGTSGDIIQTDNDPGGKNRKEAQKQNELLFLNTNKININSPEVTESTANSYFGLEDGAVPEKLVAPGYEGGYGSSSGGYYTPRSPEEFFDEKKLAEYND